MAEGPVGGESWEFLRKEATALERDVEAKMGALARMSQGLSSLLSSPDPEALSANDRIINASMTEIAELLTRLQKTGDSMVQAERPDSVTSARQLQRHREICMRLTKEFRKIRSNIEVARENADIFNSVRDDIRKQTEGPTSRTDILLRERSSIHNTQKTTSSILDQAVAAKENLGAQRQTFASVTTRVRQLAQTLPGVNQLIGAIVKRKNRDAVILGMVIAVCTFFCLIYWLNK